MGGASVAEFHSSLQHVAERQAENPPCCGSSAICDVLEALLSQLRHRCSGVQHKPWQVGLSSVGHRSEKGRVGLHGEVVSANCPHRSVDIFCILETGDTAKGQNVPQSGASRSELGIAGKTVHHSPNIGPSCHNAQYLF